MADALVAYTALGGRADGELKTRGVAAAVVLRECPASGMLDLRLGSGDTVSLNAVQTVLGLELPLTPGRTSENAACVAWWFGPDQWLIVAPPADAAMLMPVLAGAERSAVDVSDLRAAFELAGPHAIDVLRKGCGIDLHPRVFTTGDCALTSLARVRIALRQLDERPGYHLLVERSVAPYLWGWLVDAMREFVGA
jgi:sarcosine oxidase subunit gamma